MVGGVNGKVGEFCCVRCVEASLLDSSDSFSSGTWDVGSLSGGLSILKRPLGTSLSNGYH